jgi:hypothetical protein
MFGASVEDELGAPGSRMGHSKRLPLPLRTLMVNVLGASAGVGVGLVLCPATGEGFADAFRPYLIAVAGLVGLVFSGFVAAWLCCRDG